MKVVIGAIVGTILLLAIFILAAELSWVVLGPLWILAGVFCLTLGIGVEVGAIAGPGVSAPPAPLAAAAFLLSLAMILKGVWRIWIGLYEQDKVRRGPPGHSD